MIFRWLTTYDYGTQKLIPYLAKSWEMAPDGLTWTFHLRKVRQFSDGHPITPEDVLFTFQVAYDETLHPSVQDLLNMGGKPFEVSAPDPYTVVIKTPSPNAALVDCGRVVPIMPKHVLEECVQERGLRFRLQRQHAARQDRHERAVAIAQYVPGERRFSAATLTAWGGQGESPASVSGRARVFDRARSGCSRSEIPRRRAAWPRRRQAGKLSLVSRTTQRANFTLYHLGPT